MQQPANSEPSLPIVTDHFASSLTWPGPVRFTGPSMYVTPVFHTPVPDHKDWMVPFSTPPLAALKLFRAALPAAISWLAWAGVSSCSFVLSPE